MAYNTRILPHCFWNLYLILVVYSVMFILYTMDTKLIFGYMNRNHKYLEASDVGTDGKPFQFTGVNHRSFFGVFRHLKISNYWKNTEHDSLVKTFYDNRKAWNTSKLGAILFKNEPYPVLNNEEANRTYVILIYKNWKFFQRRHIYNFNKTRITPISSYKVLHPRKNPLVSCSVRNCIFSGNNTDLTTADAVIVHLFGNGMIPETNGRRPSQRWIFLDDEAPRNTISVGKRKMKLSELHNLFNWSMTYRTTSDVPVPYGRTVPLKVSKVGNLTDIIPNWAMKRNDVLAAILISTCNYVSYRTTTLMLMQKYLEDRMHVHGACAEKLKFKQSCPGHYRADCEVMTKYHFYIVLENTKCKEYMTEKLFHHAYARGAIPVIQGPSIQDCEELLPPNSYLHFDNFVTIQHLVQKMVNISQSKENLLYYHQWRYHFEIRNEHGYFGSRSYHLCRVCEAMNYNDKSTSIYSEKDLKKYMDKYRLCRLSVPKL